MEPTRVLRRREVAVKPKDPYTYLLCDCDGSTLLLRDPVFEEGWGGVHVSSRVHLLTRTERFLVEVLFIGDAEGAHNYEKQWGTSHRYEAISRKMESDPDQEGGFLDVWPEEPMTPGAPSEGSDLELPLGEPPTAVQIPDAPSEGSDLELPVDKPPTAVHKKSRSKSKSRPKKTPEDDNSTINIIGHFPADTSNTDSFNEVTANQTIRDYMDFLTPTQIPTVKKKIANFLETGTVEVVTVPPPPVPNCCEHCHLYPEILKTVQLIHTKTEETNTKLELISNFMKTYMSHAPAPILTSACGTTAVNKSALTATTSPTPTITVCPLSVTTATHTTPTPNLSLTTASQITPITNLSLATHTTATPNLTVPTATPNLPGAFTDTSPSLNFPAASTSQTSPSPNNLPAASTSQTSSSPNFPVASTDETSPLPNFFAASTRHTSPSPNFPVASTTCTSPSLNFPVASTTCTSPSLNFPVASTTCTSPSPNFPVASTTYTSPSPNISAATVHPTTPTPNLCVGTATHSLPIHTTLTHNPPICTAQIHVATSNLTLPTPHVTSPETHLTQQSIEQTPTDMEIEYPEFSQITNTQQPFNNTTDTTDLTDIVQSIFGSHNSQPELTCNTSYTTTTLPPLPTKANFGQLKSLVDIGCLKSQCEFTPDKCFIPESVVRQIEGRGDTLPTLCVGLVLATYMPEELFNHRVDGAIKTGKLALSPRRKAAIHKVAMDKYRVPEEQRYDKWRHSCRPAINKRLYTLFK